MKKIFLHIGAGKTGSLALQNWLFNNSKILEKKGIYYPTFNQNITNKYQITSGNGNYFIQILREGKLRELLSTFTKRSENLLFSSEIFQSLTDTELELLNTIAQEYNYDITVILYIRDLYDMVYSSYLQLIKRHMYFNDFEYFCQEIKSVQQFDVLYKYEKIFDKMEVVHYDAYIEEGIEKPLCKILNLNIDSVNSMIKTKVNRSLDVFEAELLKQVNRIFGEELGKRDDNFSIKLSDSLIFANPEKKTEIFYSHKVYTILTNRFSKDIDYINKKYLFNKSELNVFEKKDKFVIEKVQKIAPEFFSIVKSTVKYLSNQKEFCRDKVQQNIDIVGILYQKAKGFENRDIEKSIQILKTAKILRPNGVLLNKTLDELERMGQSFTIN